MRLNNRTLFSAMALACATIGSSQLFTMNATSTITGVSNTGLAVGYNSSQYFTWTGTGATVQIGGVVPGNGNGGWPSVTSDGTKIGGTALNSATGKSEMAYYTGGVWTTCGNLGSFSGSSASSGYAMGKDGNVLAGNAWIDAGHTHAVTWSGGTMTDLGTNLSTRSTRANGVSDDGSLVGGWQDRSDGYRSGAVWVNGAEQVLTSGGNPVQDVNAISADGQWAVGKGGGYFTGQTYLWNRNTGLTFMNSPFASNYDAVSGMAVSADGSVVVGYARDTDPLDFGTPDKGWIWTQATGMMDFGDWCNSIGINTGGNYLLDPSGISADGTHIVGWGAGPNGVTGINWMVSTPVPEPATMAVLAIGALAMMRRRRK